MSIRSKGILVILTIHAGFAMLAYGLYHSMTVWSAAGGALAYAGFLMAAVFLYMPVAPWLKRYQALAHWQEWIWRELPLLLSLIPLVLALGKAVQHAWAELKQAHGKDELDVEKFAKIITQVADQADALISPQAAAKPAPRKRASKKAA